MKLGFQLRRQVAQNGLAEWCTLVGDLEATSLEVTDGKAGCIRIHEIPYLPSTIREYGRIVLAFQKLAVVDEKFGGSLVTQRPRLQLFQFLQREVIW